jgi:hypothetical protein
MTEQSPVYRIDEYTGIEWRHGEMPLFRYVPFHSLERYSDFIRFICTRLPIALEDSDGVLASINKAAPHPMWIESEMPEEQYIRTPELAALSAAALRAMLAEKPIITLREEDTILLPEFRVAGVANNGRRYTAAFNRMLECDLMHSNEEGIEQIVPGVYVPTSGVRGPEATLRDLFAADELNQADNRLLAKLEEEFRANPTSNETDE